MKQKPHEQAAGAACPVRIFYDPEALIRTNETGECCSIVARNQ
jgi:hypothetical protein